MGKYMKKSKITADVAVMELSPQSSMGVHTRAKTLALQRLTKKPLSPSPTVAPNPDASSSPSYLQLRSRRLEKPPHLTDPKKEKEGCRQNSMVGSKPRLSLANSGSSGSVSPSLRDKEEGCFGECANGRQVEEDNDVGLEASFGENNMDFDAKDRTTRESTPCSMISGSDTLGTPGSTTRRTSSTAINRRVENGLNRNIPTSHEMEEYFACAEEQQKRLFIEKYNFDIMNDMPLPGRYKWVQIIP